MRQMLWDFGFRHSLVLVRGKEGRTISCHSYLPTAHNLALGSTEFGTFLISLTLCCRGTYSAAGRCFLLCSANKAAKLASSSKSALVNLFFLLSSWEDWWLRNGLEVSFFRACALPGSLRRAPLFLSACQCLSCCCRVVNRLQFSESAT